MSARTAHYHRVDANPNGEELPETAVISVLAVVGPTASGKTSLGIELAERLGTEIISADSMQVYRGMDIGTAAPTPDERARVKHHFVGFLDPGQSFSAGQFEREARRVVADLNRQGKPAVLVGGSGLYVRAVIDGLFEGPCRDEVVRARLHDEARTRGVSELFARLCTVDPSYAAAIHPGDLRRIVRALEAYEIPGTPLSEHFRMQQVSSRPLPAVQVMPDWPRDRLYERINHRVDRMIESGFIDEVKALVDAGFEERLLRLRSLGYREFIAHLRGQLTLEQAADAMKMNTRRFAKRQLTWFLADRRIHRLPPSEDGNLRGIVERVLSLTG
jgi:tRNA dimethylallyltransferase